MLPDKRLNDAHIKYGIQALNIYDKCPKIGTGDVRQKHLSRLQGEINASHYWELFAHTHLFVDACDWCIFTNQKRHLCDK